MCLLFGWKASTKKSEQTRILVLKTRRQDWCFHGAIEHLRAMWILICHHMNPYNITRFKIFKPYYSTVFNPYPPVIKRGKLMQAGKNLHFYTHIYSGLPHLFHTFSQLRSPPFGVGISYLHRGCPIFSKKNIRVCLSHMFPCSERGIEP